VQRHLTEELTLVASVVKWAFYATLVGILVGLGMTAFLQSLAWSSRRLAAYPGYYFSLPLFMLASAALVRWLAPFAAGHGTNKVIESVHTCMGRIPFAVVPVKLVATVITIAGGGSAGKECPGAQIGAGIASKLADMLRVEDGERRKLVICGISAGFATAFGTPIAGAIFGVEVLVLGQMFYDVLFPSLMAGIVAYHVTSSLGSPYPPAMTCLVPQLTGWNLLQIIGLGMMCGVVALLFIEGAKAIQARLKDLAWHWSLKALFGGILLVLIGRFVSTAYLGLGMETIGAGLRGEALPMGAMFWKCIASSITLGSGGNGGIITPILFVGTAAGNLFAQLFNPAYIAAFSSIGMVALLAGTANTPIAASVMAIELFGGQIAPYAALACMVSFLIVGYRSVYPSQLLGIQKSASLVVPTGKPIGSTHAAFVPRESSIAAYLLAMLHDVKERWRT